MNTTDAKILIIENETDLSEALVTVLAHEGYTVHTEEDGATGLAKALEEKPDIILLDIMLPTMDGFDLLKALRADEWGSTANVIIMTAFDDVEKMAKAVEYGVDDYIVKTNITLASVVKKVQEKLSK